MYEKIYLESNWNTKVLIRQRRCVRCNKLLFGAAEMVNVYDQVGGLGRHMGVKCLKPYPLIRNSPEWVKKYWLNHGLSVLLKPDYFSKNAYRKAIKEYSELMKGSEELKRLENVIRWLNKNYPNKWDKEN